MNPLHTVMVFLHGDKTTGYMYYSTIHVIDHKNPLKDL